MATTADGNGYWLVDQLGDVATFGDASCHGSLTGVRLDAPVVGMAADLTTGGYWLAARDGGVFSFGAPFRGSMGDVHLSAPVVAISALPDGRGYRLAGADGAVYDFGAARYYGRATVGRASSPPQHPASSNLIDLHDLWTAPTPMDAAAAYLEAHPPHVMTVTSHGEGGRYGQVSFSVVADTLTALPKGIAAAGLVDRLQRRLRDADSPGDRHRSRHRGPPRQPRRHSAGGSARVDRHRPVRAGLRELVGGDAERGGDGGVLPVRRRHGEQEGGARAARPPQRGAGPGNRIGPRCEGALPAVGPSVDGPAGGASKAHPLSPTRTRRL
ncbi:MAG: hypothetical protein ACRDZQ_06330 [Acidimicrobiales bacterium]